MIVTSLRYREDYASHFFAVLRRREASLHQAAECRRGVHRGAAGQNFDLSCGVSSRGPPWELKSGQVLLETPSLSTISLMLEAQGGFSPAQVDRFLSHHLDRSTADHVLTVTQTLGPLQRQREIEAYALQSQTGMVESLLTRHC